MVHMAKEIYSKHLCIGAQEPVNVDSHARQVAQDGLDSPTPELFLPAQKQVCIFYLPKNKCAYLIIILCNSAVSRNSCIIIFLTYRFSI